MIISIFVSKNKKNMKKKLTTCEGEFVPLPLPTPTPIHVYTLVCMSQTGTMKKQWWVGVGGLSRGHFWNQPWLQQQGHGVCCFAFMTLFVLFPHPFPSPSFIYLLFSISSLSFFHKKKRKEKKNNKNLIFLSLLFIHHG